MSQNEYYIADFTIRLRAPIRSGVRTFPDLHVTPSAGNLTKIFVSIAPDANLLISRLAARCIYSGRGFQVLF